MSKARKYSPEEMASYIKEWESSGLRQPEFCKSKGISLAAFKYYRYQQNIKHKKRSFVPLRLKPSETRESSTALEVKITYPNGVNLQMSTLPEVSDLEKLIKVY